MNWPIYFDNELLLKADEVHYIRPDRVLPSKFESRHSFSPKKIPQLVFMDGGMLPQIVWKEFRHESSSFLLRGVYRCVLKEDDGIENYGTNKAPPLSPPLTG